MLLTSYCTSGKNDVICYTHFKQGEWYSWAHKPGLTHISLVSSLGPSCVDFINI